MSTLSEVKVNAKMWNGLSSTEKAKIEGLLKSNGLLRGASIKPDDATPDNGKSEHPKDNLCQILCEGAYIAALSQCGGDPGCTQVVNAAYQVCRSQC